MGAAGVGLVVIPLVCQRGKVLAAGFIVLAVLQLVCIIFYSALGFITI